LLTKVKIAKQCYMYLWSIVTFGGNLTFVITRCIMDANAGLYPFHSIVILTFIISYVVTSPLFAFVLSDLTAGSIVCLDMADVDAGKPMGCIRCPPSCPATVIFQFPSSAKRYSSRLKSDFPNNINRWPAKTQNSQSASSSEGMRLDPSAFDSIQKPFFL